VELWCAFVPNVDWDSSFYSDSTAEVFEAVIRANLEGILQIKL